MRPYIDPLLLCCYVVTQFNEYSPKKNDSITYNH